MHSQLPEDAEKIDVKEATVDFYTYIDDGVRTYQFDSSMTAPPEPMINAIVGLRLIDSADKRLVMINHKSPIGLFNKIRGDFDYAITDMEDGKIKIVFEYRFGKSEKALLDDPSCEG